MKKGLLIWNLMLGLYRTMNFCHMRLGWCLGFIFRRQPLCNCNWSAFEVRRFLMWLGYGPWQTDVREIGSLTLMSENGYRLCAPMGIARDYDIGSLKRNCV